VQPASSAAAPAAAPNPRAAWETEEPPPFDDSDAPPDADAPPDEPYAATPYVSRPTPVKTPAASTPAAAAPGSVAGSGSAPVNWAASGAAASRASSQMANKPGFSEKQRYGEAVIREILGASFIEEQPHDSTQRPRGA